MKINGERTQTLERDAAFCSLGSFRAFAAPCAKVLGPKGKTIYQKGRSLGCIS
jgi:hypothetical protein